MHGGVQYIMQTVFAFDDVKNIESQVLCIVQCKNLSL